MSKKRFVPSKAQLAGHATPSVPAVCNYSTDPTPATTYDLSSVLCLYRRRGQSSHAEISMLHTVDKGIIQPGRPVNPVSFAKTIYRLKEGEKVERLRLLHERVLAENHRQILWWRPAAPAKLWFKTASPFPELTALNGIEVPQPALVFLADKQVQRLRVWALAESIRPDANTELYYAPYMNLSPAPDVCLGSARSKKDLDEAERNTPTQWEFIFFDSNFSHTPPRLNYEKLTTESDFTTKDPDKFKAYAAFLQSLLQGNPAEIFRRALVREGKRTLGSVL